MTSLRFSGSLLSECNITTATESRHTWAIITVVSPLKVWWLVPWPTPPSCSTPRSSLHWAKLVRSSSARRCCSSWFPRGCRRWSVRHQGQRWSTRYWQSKQTMAGICWGLSNPAKVWGVRALAGQAGLQEHWICSHWLDFSNLSVIHCALLQEP